MLATCYQQCWIAVGILLICSMDLAGQSACGTRFPFSTSSSQTYCADTAGVVVIEFQITNGGDPGSYSMTFPDGADTTLENVSGSVLVQHLMQFECGRPPGSPLPPDADNPFYQYNNDLEITRTDCVDEQGDSPKGLYKFNVIPNPIQDVIIQNATCLQPPFTVSADAVLCNEFLVEGYQWLLDGEPIRNADERTLDELVIPRPGEYLIGLEVTTARGCGRFVFEKPVVITAGPIVDVTHEVADPCADEVVVSVDVESENVETYSWTASSAAVTFSDPSAAEPTITIDNGTPGNFTISVIADNATCPQQRQSFTVSTLRGQQIEQLGPLTTCTNSPLSFCDLLRYEPEPDSILWTSTDAGVSLAEATTTCPTVTATQAGAITLTASGIDKCGDPFSQDFTVTITDGEPLAIDFSPIDTLCSGGEPVDLLDYISPAGNVRSIRGPGVSTNTTMFDPRQVFGGGGEVQFSVTDSCGATYTAGLFVLGEGSFVGGNPRVCLGTVLDLNELQAGSYTGPGVAAGRFDSEQAGIGSFTVEFVSSERCGGAGSFTVTVEEAPSAGFAFATESCADAGAIFPARTPIAIGNTSVSPTLSYRVLETGDSITATDSATFTFPTAGTYTLRQIAGQSGGACADTLLRSVEVVDTFSVSYTVDIDSSGCDSLTLRLQPSAAAPLSYAYQFSTGERSDSAAPMLSMLRPVDPLPLFTRVEASNACYSSVDSFTTPLPRRFQVGIGVLADNKTVCSGDTVPLVDRSVNATSLTFTLAGEPSEPSVPAYLVLTNDTEATLAYPLSLSGERTGCPSQTVADTIFVRPITTQAAFSLSYDDRCSPAALYLSNASTPGSRSRVWWGDGSTPQEIGENDTLLHYFSSAVDTVFEIQLDAELCGPASFSQEFAVLGTPDASFTIAPPPAACTGEEFTFTPSAEVGTNSLEWVFGDGTFSLDAEPVHSYDSAGAYSVNLTVVATNGCTASDSSRLEVGAYDGPPLLADIPTATCANNSFLPVLSGGGGSAGITYDYGNGLQAGHPGLSVPYTDSGSYRFVISSQDAAGCRVDTAVTVTVHPEFRIRILPEDETLRARLGDSVQLTFVGEPARRLDSILWTGDRLSSYSGQFTVATPVEDGPYSLTVTDEFGCTASDSLRISVNGAYTRQVFVPNAFSPNGDGRNEHFGADVNPTAVARIDYLRVFNRWGSLVYECTDCRPAGEARGWDGRLGDGAPAPTDTYVWSVGVTFIDGRRLRQHGSVNLLR